MTQVLPSIVNGDDSSFSFFFVPGDVDLWHSNSSERGTKHVFPVNLAQIRSAIPEILSEKQKKTYHRQG